MPRINHFIVLMLENRVEETPTTQGEAAAAIEAKLEAAGL